MNSQSNDWRIYYIAGIAEDANISTDREKGYQFDLESKCLQWIQYITRIISEISGINVKIRRHRKYWRIRFWNRKLVSIIYHVKNNPKTILQLDDKIQIAWLRGVYDAEGTIHKNMKQISIYNNNPKLVETVKKIIEEKLHIKTRTYKPRNRNTIQIYITGRIEVLHFLNHVKPSNKCKIPRINPAHDTRSQTESSRARAPIDPAVCYIDVGSSHPGGAARGDGASIKTLQYSSRFIYALNENGNNNGIQNNMAKN